MAFISRTQLFVATFFCFLLSHVIGHSYMTTPISRSNQAQSQSGCRGPACMGPCDIPLSQATRAPIAATRGETIVVDWPRNNHAGGFIRFAWAPTSLSDNMAEFDNHVQQINCHEIGNPTPGECAPSDPVNDPNGAGSGPGDGSSGACNTNITVPLDLTDGEWTLQWAWFGGAFSLGDYYSCADYTISGGPTGTLTPVFKGGDFTYPNQQKCKFFNTDKLHVCTVEPCQNPIYPASQEESGPPAPGQLGNSSSSSPAPAPVPATPATTGRAVAMTTGRVVPMTTGHAAPMTTGMAKPSTSGQNVSPAPVPPSHNVATTGRAMPSTTASVPAPVPAPSGTNCAGATKVMTSTASVTEIDSWSSQFHMLVTIQVTDALLSNWVLEITWPSTATSTQVVRYFNGGMLLCQGSLTSYFGPAAPWADNLASGSTVQVEFVATNTNNMDPNYIVANTQFRVLAH